jgi:hypothetical protein
VYSTVYRTLLRGVMSYNIHISVHDSRFPSIRSSSNDLYFHATSIQLLHCTRNRLARERLALDEPQSLTSVCHKR